MRILSATALNEIANDPRVRPLLFGGSGRLDLCQVIGNPANVTMVCPLGGFVVIQMTPQLYEFHTIFTPDRDGLEEVLKLAHETVAYLFTHTLCTEMITRVADDNRGAHIVAVKGGFRDHANIADVGLGTMPAPIPGKAMRQTLDDWTLKAVLPLVEGFAFHSILEEAKQASGSALLPHAEDERHDRFVGAAILMAKNGQVQKGWETYNRAAFIYGYRPITLLSVAPAIVDTGDAVVGIENGQIEVMLCR